MGVLFANFCVFRFYKYFLIKNGLYGLLVSRVNAKLEVALRSLLAIVWGYIKSTKNPNEVRGQKVKKLDRNPIRIIHIPIWRLP